MESKSTEQHVPFDNQPILDPKMLQNIRDLTAPGEKDFLDELIQLFITKSPTAISEIQEAIANHDSQKMARAAHSLKGSSGNLGVKKLMACCEKIEQLGYQGRIDEAADLFKALEQTYVNSTTELLTWRSDQSH